MKNLDYSVLLCGIVYLSKRLGKELPNWNDWSSNDLREYLKDLEIEFVQRGE